MSPFIEQNCTFEHAGREFSAGGAVVTDDIANVYVGSMDPFTKLVPIKDWHGNLLGAGRITARWKQYHMAGPYTMAHVKFTIDGRHYTGRYSPDYGDLVKARRCKHG